MKFQLVIERCQTPFKNQFRFFPFPTRPQIVVGHHVGLKLVECGHLGAVQVLLRRDVIFRLNVLDHRSALKHGRLVRRHEALERGQHGENSQFGRPPLGLWQNDSRPKESREEQSICMMMLFNPRIYAAVAGGIVNDDDQTLL